jgi:hypothetical protein
MIDFSDVSHYCVANVNPKGPCRWEVGPKSSNATDHHYELKAAAYLESTVYHLKAILRSTYSGSYL